MWEDMSWALSGWAAIRAHILPQMLPLGNGTTGI